MATSTTSSAPSIDASVEPTLAPTAATTPNGLSVTGLVLGIVGIVLGQWWISAVAIAFGFIARSKEPAARLMANWALVLGFVGVLGGFLLGLLGFAALLPLLAGGAFDLANAGLWDLWDL